MSVGLLIVAGVGSPLSAFGISTDHPVMIDKTSEATNPPIFPQDAMSGHIGGTVILMVKVGSDGVAKDIKVLESSGVRSLDVAAIKAAYKWRYFPAVKDDRPVEGYAKVPVSFAGNPVQRTGDHSVRKRFVTRNDAEFGGYAKAAEARVLAKGIELYPDDARKNHWYGSIVTTTCIARDGSVASVDVMKSSGIERLDRSIVESTKAAAPFDKLMVGPDGPDQLCITATYEYAHGNG